MYSFFKRLLDIVLTVPSVILLSPVYLVVFIAIRVDSKGPAIFTQERAGKGGKPFILYKYRTMRTDVDPFGSSPKSGEDSRLTKFGTFLRETSLDELPQLFNILRGHMTLVGPRPLYIQQMAEWDQRQSTRLLVKPGLTGLAQVSGRGHLTREAKLELDAKYVETRSFGLDMKIIFATFCQVLGKSNIYEKKYSDSEETRQQKTEGGE